MSSSSKPSKTTDPKDSAADKSKEPQKQALSLEEDDEFEDFPVEDWKESETDVQNPPGGRLWEESWDDDDTTEDFSTQLREELKKNPAK
ncbi:DSS1/SEM1 family-domain-containing protein [Tuber indicum]|nr:DSS1/SEM1 family-domain-containing protein [Tuber indicum]